MMENPKTGFIKFNVSLMKDYELKLGEALVYGALVSFRNMSIQSQTKDEKGRIYAFPPILSIANITGISKRSVKSHIQVLEQKGLMAVQRSYKEGSKERNVNRYYLNNEVLKIYFSTDVAGAVTIDKPKSAATKGTPKELKQTIFITDADIEKWFTHYKGEHNNNSAKKLNHLTKEHGAETVVKAIHNAMEGVDIDTLPNGTTGLILSRLNEKNLRDAGHQIQTEKDRQERFMNEPVAPFFDYTADMKRNLSGKVKTGDDISKDVYDLLGVVL
ncbi:helix-turn-helix domain-containing protein [Virgibacillus sp. FSP13]